MVERVERLAAVRTCLSLRAIPRDEGRGWLDCSSRPTNALPHPGSPVRWSGSRPLDREHPGVQPVAIVICRSQAARSGEPAPPDAALLSRLSLQRSVPGVWLLRAGIQMSVPSWRQFPSLSARQHLGAADRDQCGACHSGCRFFCSVCAVHRCPPAALFGFERAVREVRDARPARARGLYETHRIIT